MKDYGHLDKPSSRGCEQNGIGALHVWHAGCKVYRAWWWTKQRVRERKSFLEIFRFLFPNQRAVGAIHQNTGHLMEAHLLSRKIKGCWCHSPKRWSLDGSPSLSRKIMASWIYTFITKWLLSTIYQKRLYMIKKDKILILLKFFSDLTTSPLTFQKNII